MSKLAKYQIHPDILQTLICSECFCYLSCGPVRLKIKGGLVCGRCLLPDNSFVQDTPYENVAKMLLYPCRYNKYGCKTNDVFNTIREHEDSCEFKEYYCPLDVTCQWKGSQKDIFKHAEENHNDKVLKYPCLVPHIFTNSHVKTYITSNEDLTFLIHVKMCLATRKIYHCVRFVGDSTCAAFFEFTLSIESPTSKLTKCKVVSPFCVFEIEDCNSLVTSLTGLQEIFDDLQSIKFVVSVRKVLEIIRCVDCAVLVKKFMYKCNTGYKCENCVPEYEKCDNCDYKDFKTKLTKHSKYFCKNKQSCTKILPSLESKNPLYAISDTSAVPETLSNTYPNFFHESGVFWKTRFEHVRNRRGYIGVKVIHAIKHDFGYALCEFYKQMHNSNVMVHCHVFAPLSSDELNLYDCHLVISREDKNFKFEGFLERETEFQEDWTINFDYFDSCEDLDVKVSFLPRDIYKHPKAVINKDV